jgi:glyoxylase-like metal-dependent hydrolase (beta-lactamase superfamily II)
MRDASLTSAELEMSDLSPNAAPQTGMPDKPIEFRGLLYPLGQWVPSQGDAKEIAPGILWFRLPLPMGLNHINLYALDEGDGWALVDTGLATSESKDVWRTLFAGPLAGRPITRVIVTHYHPDHLGLAGWLCRKFNVELWIARTEFLMARMLMLDVQPTVPDDVLSFYRRAGWSAEALDKFKAKGWGNFARAVSPLPAGFRRMKEGDVLTIGNRAWRVIVGRGHTPEHVCLLCDADQIILSGDQVLPKITSNVSVYSTEPQGDPLGDWMDSLDMLETLSPDLLVLPSHNEPFRNIHTRVQALRADHLGKLERLRQHCASPKTALQSFECLFKRPIQDNEMMMATGEALAHLHYLTFRRQLTLRHVNGVDFYTAV